MLFPVVLSEWSCQLSCGFFFIFELVLFQVNLMSFLVLFLFFLLNLVSFVSSEKPVLVCLVIFSLLLLFFSRCVVSHSPGGSSLFCSSFSLACQIQSGGTVFLGGCLFCFHILLIHFQIATVFLLPLGSRLCTILNRSTYYIKDSTVFQVTLFHRCDC